MWNLEFTKFGWGKNTSYYNYSDGINFGDFIMGRLPGNRIWAHSFDGVAVCHILGELVLLCRVTRDPGIITLSNRAVTIVLANTYFFDLPYGYNKTACGGQIYRTDIPLLYLIGPSNNVTPLLDSFELTKDDFWFRKVRKKINLIAHC